MRLLHFESFRPICPLCRQRHQREVPLKVASVTRESPSSIEEGILNCTGPDCQCEYPILDGIPVIVANIRSYLSANISHLLARDDLSGSLESLVGDCCGPGSEFDNTRQHLSTYAWDHYAEFDPDEDRDEPGPGSVVRVLQRGLELCAQPVIGPVLDAGCSVGRITFELARRGADPVLGIDLNLAKLRLAARVLQNGMVRYPRRRIGLVYERREFRVPLDTPSNVDFWACDVMNLPFPAGTVAAAVSLNVLDCVPSPLEFLRSLHHSLQPGSTLLVSTPYDWSGSVTPVEAWVGGHSQRGTGVGACEPILRNLLTPGAHPNSLEGLRIVGEAERVPWNVRLHERSTVTYRVHMIACTRHGREGSAELPPQEAGPGLR